MECSTNKLSNEFVSKFLDFLVDNGAYGYESVDCLSKLNVYEDEYSHPNLWGFVGLSGELRKTLFGDKLSEFEAEEFLFVTPENYEKVILDRICKENVFKK